MIAPAIHLAILVLITNILYLLSRMSVSLVQMGVTCSKLLNSEKAIVIGNSMKTAIFIQLSKITERMAC